MGIIGTKKTGGGYVEVLDNRTKYGGKDINSDVNLISRF